MSTLKSYDYPGWGTWAAENLSYTQAIRVGDFIKCSGQGGWDGTQIPDFTKPELIAPKLADELRRAFDNVELNLKHAGGKGWSQVYKVVTYSTDIPAQHELIVENLRRVMPGHRAIWTELGVKELGSPFMHFEIDVEAYDPESAEKETRA